MSSKIIRSIAFLALASALPAQVVSEKAADYLESVRSATPPMAFAGFEWHDTHDLQDGGGDASWNLLEARAPFYFRKFTGGTGVSLGLDYSLVDLDINSPEQSWSGQLHALYLPVSFTHRPENSRWFFLGQAAPGLRTDFESIDSDDFAFRSFVAAMRQINDTLVFGVGAYVSYDVDETFAVPGIGFTWKPNDEWLVSLIPPQLAVSYEPSDDWIFSLSVRPRSFMADLDEGPGAPDLAKVKYGRLGLTAKRRLLQDPGIWLSLTAGYTLYSEVELQRDGGSLIDGDLDQGFFAGAALELLKW